MTTQEIIGSIDDRLQMLADEIDTLEAARAALAHDNKEAGNAPVARETKPTPATKDKTPATKDKTPATTDRPARSRKRTATVTAATIEQLLAGGAELTTTAVAASVGGDREQVLTLLRGLEGAGKVRRIGEKRGTKWRLFTEEDWIAQRAAELAARSRAKA